MRLITWNTRHLNDLRRDAILELAPDILLLQEVYRDRPSLDVPGYNVSWHGFKDLGLAVLWRTDRWALRPLEELSWELVVPFEVRGPRDFTLLAVWDFNLRARDGRAEAAREVTGRKSQVLARLSEPTPGPEGGPFVVAGDFNSSQVWDSQAKYRDGFAARLRALGQLGLVSAYHAHSGEEFGSETRPTLLHTFREDRAYHIDYVFLPESWMAGVKQVEVGEPQRWIRDLGSDHAPLLVELGED